MKLWIDDCRPAPTGYIWVKSVNAAKEIIEATKEEIEILSVDHDAGYYAQFGGDGIINDIYWFTEADPALRDKQGVIFISEAQDEALNDDIDKRFEDKTGWTVGAVGNI